MPREWIFLECSECKMRYYRTTKDARAPGKLQRKKFCPGCRKRVDHKEKKK